MIITLFTNVCVRVHKATSHKRSGRAKCFIELEELYGYACMRASVHTFMIYLHAYANDTRDDRFALSRVRARKGLTHLRINTAHVFSG